MNLKGKTAMVTGASRGIGRETALALAREGANVAISARTGSQLEEVAAEIRKHRVEVVTFSGDMSDETDIRTFVKGTLDRFGRLDILVNNAGIGRFHPVADMPTAEWDAMFNLNVRGLFLMTRECLPALRRAGESVVVNVVSLAGKNSFAGGSGYAATKHAVLAFSRCLMLEERRNGLGVLAICPGSVDTHFSFPQGHEPARDHILRPGDIAESILFMIHRPQHAMISEIDIRPSAP